MANFSSRKNALLLVAFLACLLAKVHSSPSPKFLLIETKDPEVKNHIKNGTSVASVGKKPARITVKKGR
jgi:hypothetical protein